jgi:hypothetical protein
VFQKTDQSNKEELLLNYIRHAGYKRATTLQKKGLPHIMTGRDVIFETAAGNGRTGLFLISILIQMNRGTDGIKALILTQDSIEVGKIVRQYKRFAARTHDKPIIAGLGTDENIRKELRLLANSPDIVVGTTERIIDHIRRENIRLEGVQSVTLVAPEAIDTAGFDKDILFIYSKLTGRFQTQVFCSNLDRIRTLVPILKRPSQILEADWNTADNSPNDEVRTGRKEKPEMKTSNNSDNAQMAEYVKSIVKKIKEDENPEILNDYRKIFRKTIPLHLRAYVTAYLLKESFGPDHRSPGRQNSGGRGSSGKGSSGYKTIFVSVGKNRRVFPKDLTELFSDTLAVPAEQIGAVKILESYSFIDIPESKAQLAIDRLNGSDFRGRKITVNFARKKT